MQKTTLEEALKIVYSHTKRCSEEEVSFYDASGRYVSEDVYASVSHPPFSRSAMDGYAVRAEEIRDASGEHPVIFPVEGVLYAGSETGTMLNKGCAMRIMTGAPIPMGADCVVRQEDTDCGSDRTEIYTAEERGKNCVPQGEDFLKGDLLLKKGSRVDAYAAAAMAAGGVPRVKVFRRPGAALLTTGDELTCPGEVLLPGKIYNSNEVYLAVRLKEMGCERTMVSAAGDNLEEICSFIEKAADQADLIITAGGVSVGAKDLLPEAIQRLGGEILFHGLDIKPGMPTMFSIYQGIPVLSLSGNPYSAAAAFEVLMQPFWAACRGEKQQVLKVQAEADERYVKKGTRRRLLRGYLENGKVRIFEKQGNTQLKSGIGSNCLVDLPGDCQEVMAGDRVEIWKIIKEG